MRYFPNARVTLSHFDSPVEIKKHKQKQNEKQNKIGIFVVVYNIVSYRFKMQHSNYISDSVLIFTHTLLFLHILYTHTHTHTHTKNIIFLYEN